MPGPCQCRRSTSALPNAVAVWLTEPEGFASVNILSYNPGHDGAIAHLRDARLIFSVEAEKDSNWQTGSRHPCITTSA